MHVNWKHLAITLAVLPIAALLFAWIGFFNVGASSGHWKITDWFLHFAMRSAIRTYALAVDVPEKLPEYAIQPAAGHFARGCAICHGAPGERRSPAVLKMLPLPPDLTEKVGEWSDAELFRIVKHGVRFTGMPAWPTQDRDDEVWAMIAFLRALPGLDGPAYRALAHGQGGAPATAAPIFDEALRECVRCHGADGLGRSAATPIIAGQSQAYLTASLRAYGHGARASGFMQLPAVAVDDALLTQLAEHFAGLPKTPDGMPDASADAALGRAIAERGMVEKGVPACLGCHGEAVGNPLYPRLTGQPEAYLLEQLKLFRAGQRGGTPRNHLMANAAKHLSDQEIKSLAVYFAGR